jgi:cell migration-inducing and hyaluronan-binding protein
MRTMYARVTNLSTVSLFGAVACLWTLACTFEPPADLVPSDAFDLGAPLSSLVGDQQQEAAQDYTILAGQAFFLDRSYTVNNLVIHGKLRCPTTGTSAFSITARSIIVDGPDSLFECGSSEGQRFGGNLRILLADGSGTKPPTSAGHAHSSAPATLSVANGGTLRMFGGRVETFGWQRIVADAQAGSKDVRLETPVGWRPGDRIVLGPSGFNFAEAEEREIASTSSDGRTVTVTAPFTFAHRAFSKTYTWGARRMRLDERAEVANLSRNIVISPAGDLRSLDLAQRGAQVVIQKGGRAYLDGVEIARGGKLGVLGEYPFHWHLVGDANGQYIRNSSIHHSYQRCVTIHGTNYAEVSNNVCFDHVGHGYFLENGNEIKNVLVRNLGMLSRRAPAGKGLLVSDMRSSQPLRFSAPSTFWIANPDNDVRDNVASGSEGTGFWMSFSQGIRCGVGGDPSSCDGPASPGAANVFPARTPTLRFSNNAAHASIVGMNWDGAEDGPLLSDCEPGSNRPDCRIGARHPMARELVSSHYAPSAQPTYDRVKVWKNVATGVYYRGVGGTFSNFVAADNGRSAFFAYDQKVAGGLIVGASEGVVADDLLYPTRLPANVRLTTFAGSLLYDGPFWLQDVNFSDFEGKLGLPAVPFLNIGGSNRFSNQVERLTFGGQTTHRVRLYDAATPWADVLWTSALRDDGSISGTPGLLVPDHPMNASDGECVRVPAGAVDRGLRCRYGWGVLRLAGTTFKAAGYDADHVPIAFSRIENATGATVSTDALGPTALTNKVGLITGLRYRYRIVPSQAGAELDRLRWTWQPEDAKVVSPILRLDGVVGLQCRPKGGSRVSSMTALEVAGTTTYFWQGSSLYFRVGAGEGELTCDPA